MTERYDAAVIGGGPAGLSAAAWLARYRVRTLLLDAAEQRNRSTQRVHGYLGVDHTTPSDLLRIARETVDAYDEVTRETVPVTDLRRAGDGFAVETGGGIVTARRLILATGLVDVLPEAPGFEEHYGSAVFHCSACDGYEFRDRPMVVLGATPHAGEYAIELRRWSNDITVVLQQPSGTLDFSECRAALDREGISVREATVTRFAGAGGAFEGLELEDGDRVGCDVVFFSLGHLPRTGLAQALGAELDDDGYIVIDAEGRTSVEGVYAAGDCTPGTQLVQVAAAQGLLAAVACARSL